MNNTKVSVIIASFNSANTIGQTIDSILTQTWRNIEIIVIDGSSTDDSLEIVKSYGSRINTVISERDMGVYDAMNKGIVRASGEIIGFLNSDDIFSSNETVAAIAEAFLDDSVSVCFGDVVYCSGDLSRVLRMWRTGEFRSGIFFQGWSPPHPTFYVRRDVFHDVGMFDLSYSLAADFDFMLRCLEVNRRGSRYLPQVLVKMRVGGLTNRSFVNIVRQNIEILRSLRANTGKSRSVTFALSKAWRKLSERLAAGSLVETQ